MTDASNEKNSKEFKRKAPSKEVVRNIALRTGNHCAFPECRERLIENNKFVGELCHIEAASPGGQRFNTGTNRDDKAQTDNLLFLCKKHHDITDDVTIYTQEKLIKMKIDHENEVERKMVSTVVPPSELERLEQAITDIMSRVTSSTHRDRSLYFDLINVHAKRNTFDYFKGIDFGYRYFDAEKIRELIQFYERSELPENQFNHQKLRELQLDLLRSIEELTNTTCHAYNCHKLGLDRKSFTYDDLSGNSFEEKIGPKTWLEDVALNIQKANKQAKSMLDAYNDLIREAKREIT